jgi:hypothetical protein
VACAPASAQHSDDFETGYTASATGVVLNGQNGYYLPSAAGSLDGFCFTYAGNALGMDPNPTGGDIFVGGTGPGGGMFVRCQKDITYPSGKVTMSFDIAANFLGTLPATQNVGSFSQQDSTVAANAIMLARWANTATADTWNADMVWYNSAGAALTEVVPDPGFQGLAIKHWYRWSMSVDYAANQVVEVSIEDLTTGTKATYQPPDRYLFGGAAGGPPIPTGFRFFAGGGGAGCTLGFDNLVIEETPTACYPDCDGSGSLDLFDFLCFVNEFNNGNPYADCDGSGSLDLFDFLCFVNEFNNGCP